VRDQRIDQRSGQIARGGMHHEAGRLVDHDQLGVLVDNGKLDGFGPGRGVRRRGHPQGDRGARVDAVSRIADRSAIDRDFAGQDQGFQARARKSGVSGEHAIDPFSVFARRDDDGLRSVLRHGRPEFGET
jgi:hypothetical protein